MSVSLGGQQTEVISQFTISVLRDFGYEVDVDAGGRITDPDDLGDCGCDAPLSTTGTFGKTAAIRDRRPTISDEAKAIATASGLEFLAEQRSKYEAQGGDQALMDSEFEDLAFIGDKVVAVMIQDGDDIFEVIVQNW